MDTQEILNSFDYDFDDLSFNIDMSNKLRVDLQRISPTKGHQVTETGRGEPSSRVLAETIRKVEADTASKYEKKIENIDSAIKALTSHNTNLRSEYDKWNSTLLAPKASTNSLQSACRTGI